MMVLRIINGSHYGVSTDGLRFYRPGIWGWKRVEIKDPELIAELKDSATIRGLEQHEEPEE